VANRAKPHGNFLAGEAGELAGVSGNTIGQWARWGYIRASQSDGEPHLYSVEDVAEAAIVSELLTRGVRHRDIRRAIAHLGDDPEWRKKVLDGFKVRQQPKEWRAGKFVHPHDAAFDKDGNIFVVEWVATGRVSFLKKVS